MGPWSRIWIFFVIVATGLVLSWGQVGKKTQQKLSLDPSEFLLTESDCHPLTTPCAATGQSAGIVLGPGADGGLELESTSHSAQIDEVTMIGSNGESPVQLRFERLTGSRWQIVLPTKMSAGSSELRIWMTSPDLSAVFPIR